MEQHLTRRAVTWIKDEYFNSLVLNETSLEQWSEWYFESCFFVLLFELKLCFFDTIFLNL